MRKYLLLCTVLFLSVSGFSQDFSNKGKDFWVAYGYHQVMFGSGTGGSQEMVLYFATDQVTNITISIPGTGYTQTLTSAAGNNVLTSATIPKNGPFDAHIATEGLHNKGIHITSDKPMVAYAHIYNSSVSGATILYPTNTLGKEYYSVNYKNWSNSANSNCWFYVVATDTGTTTVEITPTGNTTGGWVAGTTYSVSLTQGQVYNVMGSLISSPNNCNPVCTGYDLTGSLIKSVSSGAGGCKRIAVFSGSGRISITCNGNNSSSDNYMVQSVPKTAWGKKYLTVPAAGNQAFNFYRICVSDPATVVKINGAVTALPLQGNFYYEIPATNQPQMIEADQPVMVAQYFTSQGACGNGNPGDPETIYLSAVEQNINTVLWNATPNFAITTHDVNIVVPNGGTALSSFTLDGAPLTGFTPHPQDANYSYIRKNVGSGFHIIKSDSGFNATAYGFGNAESYGYNAGTNIKDLYQQILVQTQYGIEQTPSVCTGAPFRFKVSLPYCADSLHWDLSNLPGPPPPPPTQIFSTCTPGPGGPDSTTVVNGKTIYWYSLPTLYNFSVIGTYPVTITAYAPNADGCGSVQDIDFNLQISDPPVPNFTWTGGGCPADVVKFQETTPQTPKTTYHFWWDFGDPASGANNNSNLRNPNHVFSGPGTYNVRYSSITTPGCLSDTLTKQVVIPDFPNASISGTATACINTGTLPITFTGTDGTAPYTFYYNINGGGALSVSSAAPAGTTATINAPTNTAGTFVYTLDSVRNLGTNVCVRNITGQTATITVLPDHAIALTSGNNNQTVCINTPIAPITYTLSGGATGVNITGLPAGLTFNVVGTTVTISGTPTTTTGSPFNYNIVTTGNSCLTATATGTITVSPDHTITLNSANSSQTVCINTPIAPITYTLGGGATNATITGLPAGVTFNVVGTTLTISGSPTTTVGSPFNFNISTTGNSCIVATASGTITVNPDHTIALTSGNNNQTVCINTAIAPITYTLGGGATGVNITGLPAGLSFTVVGTTVTISGTPTTTTGSPFNYNIVTTGNSCLTANATGTITVSPDHTITLTTANNNQAVCQDIAIVPISFTLGGGATNATVSGLPPGVTFSVVGTTVTISGTPTSAAGSPYNYTVTTSGNSCVVATSTGTITVYKLPTADFNFTVPSCDTRVITFTDLSSPNSGTLQTWSWNFGDPGSGANNTANTGGPIPHVFTSMAGSPYTVTLTVTNSFGCVSNPIASKLVTLHNRPQAGFIVPEVCINDVAAVFIDTSHITAPDVIDPNPASYYWDFGDGSPTAIQHQKDGSHLYTAVGIFTVKHAVTTLAGCTDTVTHQISINGANPTPAFVVNNPTTLCANDSVAIVNQSIVVPGNVTRVQIWWDYANSTVVDIDDDFPVFGKVYKHLYPNFQAPLTKNFTVRMRAYSGTICFNDISQVITVNAAPKVQFNNMPNTCLLVPPFQITQASEIGGVPGTGVFSGPGITPGGIFSPQVAGVGTHTIKYTFTSTAAGCVDTMSKTITVLDTAHATFSNQSPICQNSPASFTDNSTAPAGVTLNNTVWDFGDGSPIENHAPGSTFTHTFLNAGTFTVTMYNVSTASCNSTIFSKSITVDPQHHITPNGANNSQTVCINTNITPIGFTLSGGATGVTVTGLPPGLSFTVVGTQVNITGAPTSTAGSPYAYTVQTTGNTCLPQAQATGIITVNPDHSIALTSAPKSDTQSVCVNAPIVPIIYTLGGGATNASVAGLPTGVNFSVAGTTLTISGTPTSFTGGPIFNYTVTTSGNTCLVAQARGQIAVNPYPVPDFTVDKTSYCIPNAVVKFTNTTTLPGGNLSDMTFVWDFGDASGTVPNVHPTHQYTSTGPFNVKLTATSTAVLTPSGIGCSNSIVIPLTTIHPQPKAGFTSDKPSVCQDNPTVTFTDATDYKDGTSSQWHWELGDGSIRTGTATVNYTYSDTITYAVSLYTVNSIGCNSDTITKSFTVYPLPHVNAGPDRYILEGGTIILQPDVFANDPQYLWTPNQYLIDNRVLNVKVDKPQTDMTYTLTVTARGGCQQSDIVFVKLLKFPVIPNTFTPNNDGVNDTWRIDFLNTYPNNRVQVFTRTGQLVFESKGYNTPWDGTLKGKPLPVDTYYYIIEPGNGRDPITGYVTIIK